MPATEFAIESLPKGAVRDVPDDRDLLAAFIAAAPTVNWSKPFFLSEPPDEDQGSSDSCVAHSWSYYHWMLKGKDYSRRSVFFRIALSYGAYLRDGGKEIVDRGQHTKHEVPDPYPQTPANMRNGSGIDMSQAVDDLERDYYLVADSIDGIAWAVQNHKGCVFGVYGDNAGWADLLNPKPPKGMSEWAHALYAKGFHMHGGQKCVIAKSSWCLTGITEHHIKQDYFQAGRVFNAWVLIPRNTHMVKRYIVQKGGKLGVLVSVDGDGIFADTVLWAKSEEHFNQLKALYEVSDTAPKLVYPV